MLYRLGIVLIATFALFGGMHHNATAQDAIRIADQSVAVAFPDTLTFTAQIESSNEIAQVVLEYGVDKLTCGTVMAKAFPEFASETTTSVSWTWEMRQSGSEPPGAEIWYRWRVTDTAGNEQVSPEEQVVWIDDQHTWQTTSRGLLNLHWYAGGSEFADELLTSAVTALADLETTTGVVPVSPIDLYIYGSTDDMREATLYEPGWTGGQAFTDYDIVIIGISPDQREWGKRTIAHELTHVLVGHLTFSCLGSVPTWLNEGIAVYGEGGLEPLSAESLSSAIATDELISLRALSGGFSEHPSQADLSYSQSYSVVNFLVDEYGSDKLLDLFGTLRDGMPIEAGLQATYDFGLNTLEDRWRTAIGAPSRQADDAEPTATAVPTVVPTYQPIAAVPIAPTSGPTSAAVAVTATPAPTATAAPTDNPASADTSAPAGGAPPAAQSEPAWPSLIIIVVVAFVFLLLLALTAVGILLYERRRKTV